MNNMYLFGLEGSGFIITLGLILLMSGVIMYYCLRRFAMLEASMIDQGRILHSFINKIQEKEQQQHFAHLPQHNNVDNVDNVDNLRTTTQLHQVSMTNNKIEVSDDDSSDDDDDSDSSDDDSDSSDDDSDRSDKNDRSLIMTNNRFEDLIDLQSDKTIKVISMEDLKLDVLPIDNTSNINLSNTDSSSVVDDVSVIDNGSVVDASCVIEHSLLDEFNVKNEVNQEIKKGGITKMKVSELREMVLEKGLIDNEDAAIKLKKEQLIKLLQTN